MASDLTRIGDKARQEPKLCFTSLYHHVTDMLSLRDCFRRIESGKAPGIDGVSKEGYGERLEENLEDLCAKLRRLGYRPKAVRRQYIPKAGSKKKRPLGIPCFEDKLVQMAVTRVLEQIYEADFLDCSYGYRPGRTCHQALDGLGRTIQRKKVGYVVEADIKGFFDTIPHSELVRCVARRVSDGKMLHLIKMWLKAPVEETDERGNRRMSGGKKATRGTPQGGVLSFFQANGAWEKRPFGQFKTENLATRQIFLRC